MAGVIDRIARKVGEGYERPDGDSAMPIDINYARLAEWLADRKQVPADWNRKLQAVQAKAAAALKEMPPGFLGQFEGGEEVPLDYLRCKEVLGVLVSEGAERSFLGSYKGAAGTWEKIVAAYEYNLLHVGEAALALGRNADFEIPFLKKSAARAQQQLADLERKGAEALKSAAAAAADFQQECTALGIEGAKDIRAGLLGLTAELPTLVGAAVESVRSEAVGEAAGMYQAFATLCSGGGEGTAGTAGTAGAAAAGGEGGLLGALLPTLTEVREGRTEAPAASASSGAATAAGGGQSGQSGGASAPAGIDWGELDLGALGGGADGSSGNGDGGAAAAAADSGGGISWDLGDLTAALGGGGGEGGGISWDVGALEVESSGGEAAEEGAGAGAGAGGAIDISWDIDMTTAGEEAGEGAAGEAGELGASGAAAAGGGSGGGLGDAAAAAIAAAPAEVQRLIEDHGYRARLLDDLLELQGFLTQRGLEMGSKGNDLLATSVPEAVQHVSADSVGSMRSAVAAAVAALRGERLQELVLLRSSARHLDRQAQLLANKGGQEAKFKRAAREAEARRSEGQRQLMADSAKLAVLTKRTRALKEEAERALGAKLGRRVNIMGEINNLI